MRRVFVTQRVQVDANTGERRDALDQRWHALLRECELLPLLVPNDPRVAGRLIDQVSADGLLLTGGNSLEAHGGDASERDETERVLLRRALETSLPVLGVCRGMQLILSSFGVELVELEGHVEPRQEILISGTPAVVNSYHRWGCREVSPELEVWARARDGVVKAVRHRTQDACGIMWHPERMSPFRREDVELLGSAFAAAIDGQTDEARSLQVPHPGLEGRAVE